MPTKTTEANEDLFSLAQLVEEGAPDLGLPRAPYSSVYALTRDGVMTPRGRVRLRSMKLYGRIFIKRDWIISFVKALADAREAGQAECDAHHQESATRPRRRRSNLTRQRLGRVAADLDEQCRREGV